MGGQRPTNNNFTVEGIDNNALSVTGPLVGIPNDAVAEFTMLQNQFAPDFGHSSGGQFNQVVKSGTNTFHGAIYEYLENKNFNAADTLSAVLGNPLHPRFDDNRFGGISVGPSFITNCSFSQTMNTIRLAKRRQPDITLPRPRATVSWRAYRESTKPTLLNFRSISELQRPRLPPRLCPSVPRS